MLSNVLTKDHERVDKLLKTFFDSLRSGTPNESAFKGAEVGLKNHIYWEENFLFPAVYKENKAQIAGLGAEHGAIWKMLDELQDGMSKNDLKFVEWKAGGLLRVLEGHDINEENYIYKVLDRLTDEQQASLVLRVVESNRAPEGWICKILRDRPVP